MKARKTRLSLLIKPALCLICLTVTTIAGGLSACNGPVQPKVVVYTSVDQVFSEPILKDFEKKTGIKVEALYDAEATKTVGLVNRLAAEKSNPRADVFWNGEFAQTIMLKEQGILAAYSSPEAGSLPANFLDKDQRWTAFGGRARVLIVNTNLLKPEQYPRSILDLLASRYTASQIGLANPIFGTTATQAAALYAVWGQNKAQAYYQTLQGRGIQIADGNSVTRDLVANGKLAFAYTDTDDALSAIQNGKPVTVVFPDQEDGGLGTLIIPNTVAMIEKCPHPETARKLIDFLLSEATEKQLVDAGWIDIPSHTTVTGGYYASHYPAIKGMNLDFYAVYQNLETSKKDLQELFVR